MPIWERQSDHEGNSKVAGFEDFLLTRSQLRSKVLISVSYPLGPAGVKSLVPRAERPEFYIVSADGVASK